MLQVMLLSLVAGAATCVGSGFVMFCGRPNQWSLGLFLGLAVGIMSGVVIFDLFPSAYRYGSLLTTAGGTGAGFLTLYLLDNLLKVMMRFFGGSRDYSYLLRMGLLIAIGIALHDLPEGIAIAAGYSAEEQLGLLITLAIALHNIPEGMATTAPLWMGGMRRKHIGLVIIMISMITPLGAMLGLWLVSLSYGLISGLLAFAAGAMVYIVILELAPESLRCSPVRAAFGALIGLSVIIGLTFL